MESGGSVRLLVLFLFFDVSGHVLLSKVYLQPLGTPELRLSLSKMQTSLGLSAYSVPGAVTCPSHRSLSQPQGCN